MNIKAVMNFIVLSSEKNNKRSLAGKVFCQVYVVQNCISEQCIIPIGNCLKYQVKARKVLFEFCFSCMFLCPQFVQRISSEGLFCRQVAAEHLHSCLHCWYRILVNRRSLVVGASSLQWDTFTYTISERMSVTGLVTINWQKCHWGKATRDSMPTVGYYHIISIHILRFWFCRFSS